MKFDLVTQLGLDDAPFAGVFGQAIESKDLDRLDVAVAYMTENGIPKFLDTIGRDVPPSRWAIGIDDAVTQPTAIARVWEMSHAEVRLASKGPRYRFHPKIYLLWSSSRPELCVSYIGSGNFTKNGLLRNCEAGVVLTAESVPEAHALRSQWQSFWDLACPLTKAGFESYTQAYNKARAVREAADRTVKKVVFDEVLIDNLFGGVSAHGFDGTPRSATVAWLECGTASAGGRDLEFPAAMVPFFRLTGNRFESSIRINQGSIFGLSFTMRHDNGMWRLLFSSDAILAGIGRPNLRPIAGSSNRSDLVSIFRRSGNGELDFDVEFISINSEDYKTLLEHTRKNGFVDRTRGVGGRNFGYY